MAFKKTFIVSDEAINSYGFWIRTAGVRLEKANLNCPCFFNHETWCVPLGHWENVRVDDGRLLADLVIEGANEDEKLYIRKIENGDIKGASVGVDIIRMTDDVFTLKPGQTRSTIYESELFEISITALPGNSNALALRYNGRMVTLSATSTETNLVPLITPQTDMKAIAQKLGLADAATEASIIDAIGKIQLTASVTDAMRNHIEQQANELLETDAQKQFFSSLSKTDFPSAMNFLQLNRTAVETSNKEAAITKNVLITDLIQKGKGKTAEPNDPKQTFDFLQKHNTAELSRIRRSDPDQYQKLVADYANGVRYTDE